MEDLTGQFSTLTPPNYAYSPLPQIGGPYIRLLRLQPGRPGDPLICDIITESIDKATGHFLALSYVWGDCEFTDQILCGGNNVPITESLYEALEGARSAYKVKLFWADQICINQRDVVERGHQVDMMAQIYGGAKEVLIWLGETEVDGIRSGSDIEVDSKLFFNNSWISRVWTFQELYYARSAALLFHGAWTRDWNDFVALLLERDVTVLPYTSLTHQKNWTREDVRRLTEHRGDHGDFYTLLDLLNATRERNASDPRDKIYALLTHPGASIDLPDGNRIQLMQADYHASTEDCFAMATAACIVQERNLRVLAFVEDYRIRLLGPEDPNPMQLRLASWVPNWTWTGSLPVLWDVNGPWNACGPFTLDEHSLSQIKDIRSATQALHLCGFCVGVVEITRKVAPDSTARLLRYLQKASLKDTERSGRTWVPSIEGCLKFETMASRRIGAVPQYPGRGNNKIALLEKYDRIFVLHGGQVPFVLRPADGRGRYKLICPCLLEGFMAGEIEGMDLKTEEVILV